MLKSKNWRLAAVFLVALLGGVSNAGAAVSVVTTISGQTGADPGSIATDGTSLYFGVQDSIYKVSNGGGSATALYSHVIPSAPYINGLTVLGSNVYFQNANSGSGTSTAIYYAPTSGGGPVSTLCDNCSIFDGASLATDGAKLYSADYAYGRVGSYVPPSAGSFSWVLNPGPYTYEQMVALTVGGGKAYIASSGAVTGLYSVSASGGSAQLLLGSSPDLLNVNSMTYDNGTLRWTNGGNTVFSMAATGGPVTSFSDASLSSLTGITALNGALYLEGTVGHDTVIWTTAPIPEPDTSAMMLAGLGLMGFIGRRRKQQDALNQFQPRSHQDPATGGERAS